ncbi:MAG: hypothetical protein M3305_10195 [Actinomycetota bacterium]|nr:hypothetical protein [Actinomycetota bacterium]
MPFKAFVVYFDAGVVGWGSLRRALVVVPSPRVGPLVPDEEISTMIRSTTL